MEHAKFDTTGDWTGVYVLIMDKGANSRICSKKLLFFFR